MGLVMSINNLLDIIQDLPELIIPGGKQIFRQGDSCGQYFILVEGCVHVYTRSVNGKEVSLYRVTPGGMCVLTTASLIGKTPFPAEAVAESPLRLRTVTKKKFDELVGSSGAFRDFVFKDFGVRINSLIKTIQQLALETIEQRLAKYLLMQPGGAINITHHELAVEIGSAREVVSRHLKRLEKGCLVSLGRGVIEVLDRERLHGLI